LTPIEDLDKFNKEMNIMTDRLNDMKNELLGGDTTAKDILEPSVIGNSKSFSKGAF